VAERLMSDGRWARRAGFERAAAHAVEELIATTRLEGETK